MCGRVIQSSGPLRYAIVDGLNVRDSRVHNYPPRWNGAPSQELLVIRRNHKTGEISLDLKIRDESGETNDMLVNTTAKGRALAKVLGAPKYATKGRRDGSAPAH